MENQHHPVHFAQCDGADTRASGRIMVLAESPVFLIHTRYAIFFG
jgi:hypothetical protein